MKRKEATTAMMETQEIKIKNEYKENVILNLIDKITNKEYSNISIEEFENIIPLVKGEF